MSVPGINIAALVVTMSSSLNNRNPIGKSSGLVLPTSGMATSSDTEAKAKWLLIGVGCVFGILIFSGLIAITVLLFK